MRPEDVIARLFEVPAGSLSDDTASGDVPEWDSLGHVNLVLELESAFGVRLSTEDALVMKSVGQVKKVLRERGAVW